MRAEWTHDPLPPRIAARLEELAALAEGPFAHPYWHEAWIAAFAPRARRETCLVLDEAGEILGALPLLRDGRTLRAPANHELPAFVFPARDDEVVAFAWRSALGRAAELEARSLGGGPEARGGLKAASEQLGRLSLVRNEHVSPIIDLTVGEEAWRAWSEPRWHAPIERYRRNLRRREGATLDMWQEPADPASALDEAFALEASGWKGVSGTAITSQPGTAAFYRQGLLEAARRGSLRISSIRNEAGLIATHIAITHRRRAYGMRAAYDESYRKYAPGLVMMLALTERLLHEGFERCELLGADEPYKLKFAQATQEHYAVTSYRRALVPGARFASRRGGQLLARHVVRPAREAYARRSTSRFHQPDAVDRGLASSNGKRSRP